MAETQREQLCHRAPQVLEDNRLHRRQRGLIQSVVPSVISRTRFPT